MLPLFGGARKLQTIEKLPLPPAAPMEVELGDARKL
jgi:hypothetical protein